MHVDCFLLYWAMCSTCCVYVSKTCGRWLLLHLQCFYFFLDLSEGVCRRGLFVFIRVAVDWWFRLFHDVDHAAAWLLRVHQILHCAGAWLLPLCNCCRCLWCSVSPELVSLASNLLFNFGRHISCRLLAMPSSQTVVLFSVLVPDCLQLVKQF